MDRSLSKPLVVGVTLGLVAITVLFWTNEPSHSQGDPAETTKAEAPDLASIEPPVLSRGGSIISEEPASSLDYQMGENERVAIEAMRSMEEAKRETYYSKSVVTREDAMGGVAITTTHRYHDAASGSLYYRIEQEKVLASGELMETRVRLQNAEGNWLLVGDVAFMLAEGFREASPAEMEKASGRVGWSPLPGQRFSYEDTIIEGREVRAVTVDSRESSIFEGMNPFMADRYPAQLTIYIDKETNLSLGTRGISRSGVQVGAFIAESIEKEDEAPEGMFEVPEEMEIVAVLNEAEANIVAMKGGALTPEG